MIDKNDTVSLFGNNSLRASFFIDYVWNLIENEIIYSIGITDNSTISILIDNDSVIITSTSDYNILCTKRLTFYYNHVLTLMTDLCISLTIKFISSKLKKINYDMCSFYYEEDNKEDDGIVEIYCDAYYNIESYQDFKSELTMQLSKELQYFIHRNVIVNDIDNCEIARIDSIFETASILSKVNNIEFNISAKKLLKDKKICIEDYNKICNIKKEVDDEIRRQEASRNK